MTNQELIQKIKENNDEAELLREAKAELQKELDKPQEDRNYDAIDELTRRITILDGSEKWIEKRARSGIRALQSEIRLQYKTQPHRPVWGGSTAASTEISADQEHRRGLMPILLGACSMAACALIVAGMAYVLHDNSRLPMTASNVAADVTEITVTAASTETATTATVTEYTDTTVTGTTAHTLPYIRTTTAKDPSADHADAVDTEPPENPDAPKQLPVIQGEQGEAVLITTTVTTPTTATTTAAATTSAVSSEQKSRKEIVRETVENAKWCAPSFVMQWDSDQNQDFDDQLHFDYAENWRTALNADSDRAIYVQENDGERMLRENEDITGVIWFQYQADGYIPEVREMVFTGDTGLVTFRLKLVPADVHGIVRVYLPDDGVLNTDSVQLWRIWLIEETGKDTEQNTPPKLTYEED